MENKDVQRRSGSTRRTFLSASAATAVAAPILAQTVTASAAPIAGAAGARSTTINPPQNFDPALIALIRKIDPNRIQAIIEKLVSFGTRHTASSQTDPNRGIGAATAYVAQV
ncbi:MAG TPA: hypothetical protein VF506_10255, partial [Streptosporangiaceae bacterium]